MSPVSTQFGKITALLLLLVASGILRAQEYSGVEVVASGPEGLTLHLSDLAPAIDADGSLEPTGHHWLHQSSAGSTPELRGSVAIPRGAVDPVVRVVSRSDESRLLLPTRFSPAHSIEPRVLGRFSYGDADILTIALPIYRTEGRGLYFPDALTLQVTWTGITGVARPSILSSPRRFDRERALHFPNLANAVAYSAAEEKTGAEQPVAASADPIGEEALVLLTDHDGNYRLSAERFVAEGGPRSVQIGQLRLRNRGVARELWVRDVNGDGLLNDSDYLAFYGERNPSKEGYFYSELSDTNAYILTWSGGEGSGPGTIELVAGDQGTLREYSGRRHFEEEQTYFNGMSLPTFLLNDEATIHNNDRVQHERFYWRTLSGAADRPLRFDCSPSNGGDGRVRMELRIAGTNFGTTALPPQPIRAIVNGVPVGTAPLADTTDAILVYEFDANILINGQNELVVDLDGAEPSIPFSAVVDYFVIEGEWNSYAVRGADSLPGGLSGGVILDGLAPEDGVLDNRLDVSGAGVYGVVEGLQRGHLLRVTSRAGTALRTRPGFFLQVGETQVAADGGNSLGITVAEVSSDGMRVVRSLHVRTTGSVESMDQVADFIDGVATGNIVVAGTAFGTAKQEKTARFTAALRNLGSTVVDTESLFSAAWVFAAIKGDPSSAVEEHRPSQSGGISRNLFIVDQQRGRSLRGVVPRSLASGAESVAGLPQEPGVRHYKGDRLTLPENEADLVIVTHPRFAEAAERLAEHRRSFSGLRVSVVDLYQVYDEFNFGLKDPDAIRQFLQYADQNWGGAGPPTFAILFGDANWDRNQRLDGSIMVDYVPSFGVPSTDQLFVVAYGDTTLTPRQFIGRIPATSPEDAGAFVDKVILYDTQPPAEWNKKVVFATGGTSVRERDNLRDQGLSLASIITSPNFYGTAEVISRTGTTDAELSFPNDIDADRVQDAMNRGGLWLDFNGHGATTTTDLNFGFVEDFDNINRFFIFATWSCQTGLFSNIDAQLRNETFLMHPDKGSVASIGGTSFSFTNMDNPTRRLIFTKIAQEPERRTIGSIFHLSKLELYAQFFFGSPNSDQGVRARNQMMMYTLLGDPSMEIAVSSTPELTVPVESVRLAGEAGVEPALGDTTLAIKGALWNFGVPLEIRRRDSLGVPFRVTLVDPAGGETSVVDTSFGLRRHDSIEVMVPIAQIPGEYVVIIEVDPENEIFEEYEDDNRTLVSFLLQGSQPLLLEPLAYGLIDDPDNVEIRLLNPPSGPGARFVIDTVPGLDSPGAVGSDRLGTVQQSELTTTWSLSIPEGLRQSEVFWWRAISTSADPDLAERFPLTGSFRTRTSEPATTSFAIGGVDQFATTRSVDLLNTPSGLRPGTRPVPIFIEAIGQTFQTKLPSSPEIAREKLTIQVGSRNLRSFPVSGLNVLLFPPNSVEPRRDTFFLLESETGLDDFEDFIRDVITPDDLVVVATHGVTFQMFAPNAQTRLAAALDHLGSRIADTIQEFDIWASYALIGGENRPDGEVLEAYRAGGPLYDAGEVPPFEVTLRDTIVAFPTSGVWTSTVVGPALDWERAGFDLEYGAAGEMSAVVLSVRRDGRRDTLRRATLRGDLPSIDLSDVDPLEHPRLEFLLRFDGDTTELFHRLDVDYTPVPELAIVPSTVGVDRDSVLQGEPVSLEATVANLTSFTSFPPVEILLEELGELGGEVDRTITGPIAALDSTRVRLGIATDRLKSARSYRLRLNPSDQPSEPYSHNNRYGPIPLKVSSDSVSPGLAIYADDNRLMSGDYVSSTARFEVRFFDNSPMELDSIRAITMVLDNEWINVASGGEFIRPVAGESGDVRGRFYYTPSEPLSEGAHDLRVFSKDASGNGDTTEIITFFVEEDLGIRALYTWPNPMQKETTFTFNLTGAERPESGEIAIYTPAGRRIRTIEMSASELNVGNNRVEWDGRDQDGDRIANGVYFYRIRIRHGEVTTEVVEKIAVLR